VPVIVIVVIIVVLLAWGEVSHWQASWRQLGHGESAGRREAVVVLGYKNPGHRANYLNRYRVRAGIRSIDPAAVESSLVFCGGTVAADVSEAELMERYARDERGFSGAILLDRVSRSTWENIQNAIPFIEDAESIKVISNSLHAEKGRAYLRKLRPDLAERLSRGEDYRFGEIIWVKPAAAALGVKDLRALRR
jgi:uncharacterized SAM-binding protein YcdF (DUF218 family)